MMYPKVLHLPADSETIRTFHVGDMVLLNGDLFTGRDRVHHYLYSGESCPVNLKGGGIYHCGPIMIKDGDRWLVEGAGPTTSMREEMYQWKLIADYDLKVVVGKGGMGPRTREACQKYGCLYLHAVGGAAQVLAKTIKSVKNVYFLEEFGIPEAIWHFEVVNFPALVTIDAHGRSLHDEVYENSLHLLNHILKRD